MQAHRSMERCSRATKHRKTQRFSLSANPRARNHVRMRKQLLRHIVRSGSAAKCFPSNDFDACVPRNSSRDAAAKQRDENCFDRQ
jgi:hypothetical protein